MARPLDDRGSGPYATSSISSQTSLAADCSWATYSASRLSDGAGPGWRGATTSPPPPTIHGAKLGKIKSSSSHNALAAARQTSGHGRLHKRGNSVSASQSPITSTITYSPAGPHTSVNSNASETATPLTLPVPTQPHFPVVVNHSAKPKVMIKPLLRKLSAPEPNAIDLSRSPAENQGLGVYTSSEITGTPGKIAENSRRAGYHHRDASDHSYVSTMSAPAHRYGTQYVHPMKQTPRPFTPPAPASPSNSFDGEKPATGSLRGSSDMNRLELGYDDPSMYVSLPTLQRIVPNPKNTPVPFTHWGNASQTNLPTTPSSLRYQTEYTAARDMMRPSARSSLESAFRTRNRAHTDPAAQAATVAALRRKFNEKEAAKELKYQQAEARKRQKREEEERRKSEVISRKRAKSNNTTSEKSITDPMGEHRHPSVTALFEETASGRPSQARHRPMAKAGAATKAVQSQWSLFWFNFKIMWLKLKRKVSRTSA